MAGRTPHQAVRNFIDPLNKAVSCITQNIVVASGSDPNNPQAVSVNKGKPSKLKGEFNLFLAVMMRYQITKISGISGPWKVSTRAYYYGINNHRGEEILAYHWHPNVGPLYPHLHIHNGSNILPISAKTHIPTRRLSLEEILRFLIIELKVSPLKSNWDTILKNTQSKHEQFGSWS